jgi:uncharacterized protein (DUF427 family)
MPSPGYYSPLETLSMVTGGDEMSGSASSGKPVKVPGPEHPISIERNPNRVVVMVAGRVVADTRAALTLREAGYAPVQYIPRADADMALLARTDHTTYCPYKGDCGYFNIPAGGSRSINAVWTYEHPYPAVSGIKDHLAFYPNRVDAIEERSGTGRGNNRTAGPVGGAPI